PHSSILLRAMGLARSIFSNVLRQGWEEQNLATASVNDQPSAIFWVKEWTYPPGPRLSVLSLSLEPTVPAAPFQPDSSPGRGRSSHPCSLGRLQALGPCSQMRRTPSNTPGKRSSGMSILVPTPPS